MMEAWMCAHKGPNTLGETSFQAFGTFCCNNKGSFCHAVILRTSSWLAGGTWCAGDTPPWIICLPPVRTTRWHLSFLTSSVVGTSGGMLLLGIEGLFIAPPIEKHDRHGDVVFVASEYTYPFESSRLLLAFSLETHLARSPDCLLATS
jgi:hypothetical protein